MSTVNISLPKEQVTIVDRIVKSYGFANRSEFIRSLIRVVTYNPSLIDKASTFPFIIPSVKSTSKIIADFKKSGKYSSLFLADLENGLKDSDYFEK